MCGVSAAWFAYSNEDAAAHGLSTAPRAGAARASAGGAVPSVRPFRPEGEAGLYDGWKPRGLRRAQRSAEIDVNVSQGMGTDVRYQL